MQVFRILKFPHVLLRKKSSPIENFTPDLLDFTNCMIETMRLFDGIGLAAAQLGINKRVLITDVSPYLKDPKLESWHGTIEFFLNGDKSEIVFPLALVNPEIIKTEEDIIFTNDGCLSLPGVEQCETKRKRYIEVKARTIDNNEVLIKTDGIFSICLQHEIDHLDGILFIDRLVNKEDSDATIRMQIQEAESDALYRKKIKKYKPVDAREISYKFL